MRRSERFQQALGGEGLGPDNAEQRPADVLPVFRILFLANCLRTKGLFVALDAFLLLRQRLRQRGVPLKLQMDVAGAFAGEADESAFRRQVEAAQAVEEVRCLGFVSGADKDRVLREADLMCFPTFYPGENQPVTLIEALAYGLPAVTTSWRSIPDIFPDGYRGIVPPQDVEATAAAMEALLTFKDHATLRQRFCQQFTIEAHLDSLARALKSVT
jgi:glycosyltransferase involved in cell wall biosynthesis